MAKKLDIPKKGSPEYWDFMKKQGITAMRAKKRSGRPKAVTPQQFWDVACSYFEYVDKNPLVSEDFIKGGEAAGSKVKLNKMRPYTWTGLQEFFVANGILSAIDDYKFNGNGGYEEYKDVIAQIETVIYNQKFEGAAAGLLKESIIMRDLNMQDNLKGTFDGDIEITIIDKK